MEMKILLFGGALCLVSVCVGLMVKRRHRKRVARVEIVRSQHPSVVQVLRSERDLRDALHRAVEYERGLAAVVDGRAARYEAMLLLHPDTDGPIGLTGTTELRAKDGVATGGVVGNGQRHSA